MLEHKIPSDDEETLLDEMTHAAFQRGTGGPAARTHTRCWLRAFNALAETNPLLALFNAPAHILATASVYPIGARRMCTAWQVCLQREAASNIELARRLASVARDMGDMLDPNVFPRLSQTAKTLQETLYRRPERVGKKPSWLSALEGGQR